MLPSTFNPLSIAIAILHIASTNSLFLSRNGEDVKRSIQSLTQSDADGMAIPLLSRRDIESTNHTLTGKKIEEDLDITCFQSDEEIKLQPVKIVDCAMIIKSLSQESDPDKDRIWGTALTKSPDNVVPLTLQPRGSCVVQMDTNGNDYAWTTFSPNYVGFVVKEVILACLTGNQPFGGTTLFGPGKLLRLTLSGRLPEKPVESAWITANNQTVGNKYAPDIMEVS